MKPQEEENKDDVKSEEIVALTAAEEHEQISSILENLKSYN